MEADDWGAYGQDTVVGGSELKPEQKQYSQAGTNYLAMSEGQEGSMSLKHSEQRAEKEGKSEVFRDRLWGLLGNVSKVFISFYIEAIRELSNGNAMVWCMP